MPIYSSIVANHILSLTPLISSLNYSSSFSSHLTDSATHNTTILVTKTLIINLYHIIIPLTATHKNLHCDYVFPFPASFFSFPSFARVKKKSVCLHVARWQKWTWIMKPKTQTESVQSFGENSFDSTSEIVERKFPAKLFCFSLFCLFSLLSSLGEDSDLVNNKNNFWPPKMRKRVHSTRD